MVTLEDVRKMLEAEFASRGYKVVSAQEKDADFIVTLKIPKEKTKT